MEPDSTGSGSVWETRCGIQGSARGKASIDSDDATCNPRRLVAREKDGDATKIGGLANGAEGIAALNILLQFHLVFLRHGLDGFLPHWRVHCARSHSIYTNTAGSELEGEGFRQRMIAPFDSE